MLNPTAQGLAREIRSSYAFVERNWNLVRRYWGWEVAFFFYRLAASLAVVYIGKAQAATVPDLVLYLVVGTLVWAYLSRLSLVRHAFLGSCGGIAQQSPSGMMPDLWSPA